MYKSGEVCAISFTRLNSCFYCAGFIGVSNLFWNSFTFRLIQHTLMAIRIFHIVASGCLIRTISFIHFHKICLRSAPLTVRFRDRDRVGVDLHAYVFLKIVCFILYKFIRNCLVKQLFSHEIELDDAGLL